MPQCTCDLLIFSAFCAVVIVTPATQLQLPALACARMVALVQELIPALVLQGGLVCCVKQVSGTESRSDCVAG